MKTKTNKYTYLYVLQGNYGYGWDDLTQSENRAEAITDLQTYRENEKGVTFRIIKRRIPNFGIAYWEAV